MNARKIFVVVIALLAILAIFPLKALSSQPPTNLVDELRKQTDGAVRISLHADTGKVRFIGTDLEHPIYLAAPIETDVTSENAARRYLTSYGALFGLQDQAQELTVMSSKVLEGGRSVVRFQQVYQGIPVMGGELIVNLDAAKNLISANGEILPDLGVKITPNVGAQTARASAMQMVQNNYSLPADQLVTSEPELWIYNPVILGATGPQINSLVWRIEVTTQDLQPVKELVLVQAHLGNIVLNFNQIETGKNRQIYDQNNVYPPQPLPGTNLVRSEGGAPSGIGDVDNAYDYAGATYDFYMNTHGRDSLDNAGMTLISTVRYCSLGYACPYANAFWNGTQMVYGEGYASADDVVGHEMTHGVTDYESQLFYYMQSGAINESLSDIWGEFIDLTDGMGNDTPGVRWLMGEDLSIGAIRSMKDPTLFGDPDRMGSASYVCGTSDNGGVHSNSGVLNKSAYLMTDGDTFNSTTVTGIGITKVAKIFYEVQTNLLTSAGDYQDMYDLLQQSCTSLIGTAGITVADCQQVQNAVTAVEMNQQPTSCAATEAPVCAAGETANYLFSDNLENTGSGNWSHAALSGTDYWFYPQNPNNLDYDTTYATSGTTNFFGSQSYPSGAAGDMYIGMNGNVTLAAGTTPYLRFRHAYAFESGGYDGGVLEYSTNGGSSWNDAGSLIINNGYNGTISSSSNPLNSRQGFVNASYGYISTRANLSSLAGGNVRFRFRLGTDSSVWSWGWFIDDIQIYTCGPSLPTNTPTITRTPTVTPTGQKYINLPFIEKNHHTAVPSVTPTFTPSPTTPAPTGPTPGLWYGNPRYEEFYVTLDRAHVDNFAVYINVPGCGNYKITHLTAEPISGNQFSFSGSFYASGTFDTDTTAHGTEGLSNFNIPGCGSVNGGPWTWNAIWRDSTQPAFQEAYLVGPDSVQAVDQESQPYLEVEKR